MSANPLVSIIIPTYNQASLLHEALQSVCKQSFSNWEAIVINNFSDDDTIRIVQSFDDPRISLVNFKNNGVIGASRNFGVNLASGKYLAFLDSDDLWHPEKLDKCVSWLNASSNVLVCHGLTWFGKREGDHFYGPASRANFDTLLYKGNCIATSATVLEKKIFECVGGFTEDPNVATVEDYHLWMKIAKNDMKIGFIKQILGSYRWHSENSGTVIRQSKAERYTVELFFPIWKNRSLTDRVRIRFRHGLIDYGVARSYQVNNNYSKSWAYLFKSWVSNPFFMKTYLSFLVNIYLLIIKSND